MDTKQGHSMKQSFGPRLRESGVRRKLYTVKVNGRVIKVLAASKAEAIKAAGKEGA